MAERIVPGTDFRYYLIAYDEHGAERAEDGVLASSQVASAIATQPVTDVALLSHGWNGDIPSAIGQYDRWIGAMVACDADRRRAEDAIPGFRALSSSACTDRARRGVMRSSAQLPNRSVATPLAAGCYRRGADRRLLLPARGTPRVRAAVRTVVESALTDIAPTEMPPQVADAYKTIDAESGLQGGGAGAAPGDDREPFDPQEVYRSAQEEPASFGQVGLGGLLAPLRTLTFWSMKRRARYCFRPHTVYNLNASQWIKDGEGPVGRP
jgi:hypothetical protein